MFLGEMSQQQVYQVGEKPKHKIPTLDKVLKLLENLKGADQIKGI